MSNKISHPKHTVCSKFRSEFDDLLFWELTVCVSMYKVLHMWEKKQHKFEFLNNRPYFLATLSEALLDAPL